MRGCTCHARSHRTLKLQLDSSMRAHPCRDPLEVHTPWCASRRTHLPPPCDELIRPELVTGCVVLCVACRVGGASMICLRSQHTNPPTWTDPGAVLRHSCHTCGTRVHACDAHSPTFTSWPLRKVSKMPALRRWARRGGGGSGLRPRRVQVVATAPHAWAARPCPPQNGDFIRTPIDVRTHHRRCCSRHEEVA